MEFQFFIRQSLILTNTMLPPGPTHLPGRHTMTFSQFCSILDPGHPCNHVVSSPVKLGYCPLNHRAVIKSWHSSPVPSLKPWTPGSQAHAFLLSSKHQALCQVWLPCLIRPYPQTPHLAEGRSKHSSKEEHYLTHRATWRQPALLVLTVECTLESPGSPVPREYPGN